ncbi:MAG TPA: 4Fe-4S dicluster domain-containing protein [Oligoflexus sp.]|uniref:4Fe-4S dicluster domain-containing protein n=1 Tax=Oligoflexus sp. TaxID=1971216 RepID=UPI002D80A1D7|nr:4Fe-4S dicluster domain-containing protein [Oligoflexus sp.]HET9240114.1 4Fe-4S dicluster domain-containing protein [Oligoflexus sp.]
MKNDKDRQAYVMQGSQDLRALFESIQRAGYRIAGPRFRDSAIVFEFLERFEDLPFGFEESQKPGSYRLKAAANAFYFAYSVGPQSLKAILHPARRKLFEGNRVGGHWQFTAEEKEEPPVALFGIRSCDLKALHELDKVFQGRNAIDAHYSRRRQGLIVVSASCRKPSELCFCTSMGHGPMATDGFDINLTEYLSHQRHEFLARPGTARGHEFLKSLDLRVADELAMDEEETVVRKARERIKKTLPTKGLPTFLKDNLEHPQWDDVARRCLSCGNCTMVCPTCFCTTVDDITDLRGEHTERWLRWDSCFNFDFSFIHGGAVRPTTRSRYRQWLTHKLATWHDQFKSWGCVGCGRCIAWCPVGIDLTEEVKSMKVTHEESYGHNKLV